LIVIFLIILAVSAIFTAMGQGGGLIYCPLFISLGFDVYKSISTSLLLNGVSTLSAAVHYKRKGLIDMDLAIPLAVTSCIGAFAGAKIASIANKKIVLLVVLIVIIAASIRMLLFEIKERRTTASKTQKILISSVLGLIIGWISGMAGIGGGIFIVPALVYILGEKIKIAVAISSIVVVFISFVGFLSYYYLGHFDLTFATPLLLATIIGGQIGSRITIEKLTPAQIRKIFGLILLILAAKIIHRLLT